MRIDLLHVPDCPNVNSAHERLLAALAQVGATASVREVEVSTVEAALELGMHGSPTILIDGNDPFAGETTEPSLSCRLFRAPGGLEGAPTTDQLAEVLAS